jgi:phytoene synthase
VTVTDVSEVTALVKQSGTSFYHGMKILPAARRDAMYAIYAFCRIVDDIADNDSTSIDDKRQALEIWRQRIAGIYTGHAHDSVTRLLLLAAETYHLREADFIAILDGMEMDGVAIVAPPMPVLDLYCDRVAAAVGRLSVKIFGDESNEAQDVAYALGRALQLTNILRDVPEDAARGRLYLPHEYLVEAAVPLEPQPALHAAGLPHACARLAILAEKYFAQADAAMLLCKPRAMRPARLMAASYRPLLGILRQRHFDYGGGRVSLPKVQKLLLGLRIFFP